MRASTSPGCPAPVPERVTVPLCVVIFFSVLNGMMFNVAIPDIAAEYDLLPSEVSWVMTGYILLFGIGSLVYGKLADHLPVRRLITIGLTLLNAGSVLGLLSAGYPMLIAARLLQAAGGAAIPALAMLTATRYLPADIRGRVLGLVASTVALAAAVGPILGGFVAARFHWRYLFLIILASALAIPSLRRLLPAEKAGKAPFDFWGTVLLGAAFSLLLFSSTTGRWLLFAPGIVLLLLTGRHMNRARDPLIPPALFDNRPFLVVAAVTVLAIGSVFGMMFLVPLMLRDANGLSASAIGLTLFPGAMSAAIFGTVGGRLADRRGPPFVASAGMTFVIAGFLLLSSVAGSSPPVVAVSLIVSYVGFAFLQSSLPHSAASSLHGPMTGVGMGTYNLIFFLSGAFSASTVGRVLDARPDAFCLNPLASCPAGWPYSNILLALAACSAAALLLYRSGFRGAMAAGQGRTERECGEAVQ